MAGKSLADKINALITTTPNFCSDDESDDTKAKVVESYNENVVSDDEFQTSTIRKQNVDTLDKIDKRYAGKKIARKDVYTNDDDIINKDVDSESSEGNVEDEELEDSFEGDSELDSTSDNAKEESIHTSESDDFEEEDDYNVNVDSDPDLKQKGSTVKTIPETNFKTEIEKGNCIRNQLNLWESFLEMRIKLQKCVVIGNQMPQYNTHKEFRSHTDFVNKVNETKTKLTLIMDNMLQLKNLLLKQYPETKNLCVTSKGDADKDKDRNVNIDESVEQKISVDTGNELKNENPTIIDKDIEDVEKLIPQKRLKYNYENHEKVLQEDHDFYKEYRNSVIEKWNNKTRIATGLLSKNTDQTTLKQIEYAMSNISKLRKRTQLKRSEYNIVGKSLLNQDDNNTKIHEYDVEIYDDSDFYHQLLRDLIEYKSLDVTDPVQLSKQWIQLQNMRKKMKKRIDTRATKGRKVRYNVHSKLVNFMAPITIHDTWTDNAKNELYNSLFGKIKSTEERM
ncbi:hypothetical protein PUN28_010386 [Cardiocondyla obscurior]|uniref:Protein AATF n=1 Tax=Cardiocondyla obscurior TaxID=286306 RepID=A0AAW2FQN3_9HYME